MDIAIESFHINWSNSNKELLSTTLFLSVRKKPNYYYNTTGRNVPGLTGSVESNHTRPRPVGTQSVQKHQSESNNGEEGEE